MKGVIFCLLEDLVVEKFGLALWDEVASLPELESGGVYISTETYPDKDLEVILGHLSKVSSIERRDLLLVYGDYIFPKLLSSLPSESPMHGYDFTTFISNIDEEIHTEVLKLNPKASVPELDVEHISPTHLRIKYQSQRRMSALAEGLVLAAAKHFGQPVDVETQASGEHAVLDVFLNGTK